MTSDPFPPCGTAAPTSAGFPPTSPARRSDRVALAAGAFVGGFEILRVLGSGGFSIVYLARDPVLDRRVAIKEYLPAHLATRGPDGDVGLREFGHAPLFEQGLETFMNEARLLARFDHPSLLRVHRFWRERGTAYMAMPYLEGRTLLAARQAMPRPPDEAWLRHVLVGLLEAVQTLHEASCFHRDISPDNILLLPSGTPVLLDFGSARTIRGDGTQQLTAVVKPAYAPIEQYAESPRLRQGPWTDLYAWGAVARFCITGKPPPPATVRAVEDLLRPMAAEVRVMGRSVSGLRYSPTLLTAIDWALALRPADRPQSVAQLLPLLDGSRAAAAMAGVEAGPRPFGAAPPPERLAAGWARTNIGGEASDPDEEPEGERTGAASGASSDARPGAVPRLPRTPRSRRVPAGIALAGLVMAATVGWRMVDQRETAESIDRMARSAAIATAAGTRSGAEEVVLPSDAALPDGAAGPSSAAPMPNGASQQSLQAAADVPLELKPLAAPAALLDDLPSAPAAPVMPDPAIARAEQPVEEILDEPVRDVAPSPSSPTLQGMPAMLVPAHGLVSASEPPTRKAHTGRARVEPSLNDALPDRRTQRPRAKGRGPAVAEARDPGPRAYCARQERYTDYFCMKTQCQLPRYRGEAECMSLRREGWWGFVRGQWRTASQR